MNPRKRKDFAAKYKENICVLCIKYDLIMSHLRTQKKQPLHMWSFWCWCATVGMVSHCFLQGLGKMRDLPARTHQEPGAGSFAGDGIGAPAVAPTRKAYKVVLETT